MNLPIQGEAAARSRLVLWVLGDHSTLRLRVSQQLLAGALMFACSLILVYAANLGSVPMRWLGPWLLLTWAAPLLGYVLIRSGWSTRWSDPALTEPQILAAQLLGCGAYPMAGPLRGMVLPIMMLVLAFGMFRLRASRAMRLAWLSLGLFGTAILFGLHVWPGEAQRPFEIELGHFLMALVCFPGVAILAGRISAFRYRLTQQREQLNLALARIEELATRDVLTGLHNRRHAETLLQRAVQRHQRSHTHFCVALIDLDHFKRVNDRHGHAVGDAVLRAFSQAALETLRLTDTLARWGGEEFLLLLDDSDAAAGMLALDRLRHAIAHESVLLEGGGELRFTFSAGLTGLRDGESLIDLLERADQALYRAKAEGRDRAVTL